MIHSYKNAPLKLSSHKATGVNGESFIVSEFDFLCESIEASLGASLQPSYLDGQQFASEFFAQGLVQSSLSLTYYVTGEDLLRGFFDDNDSRISGNFGGLFFKEGKLSSYSLAGQPNQPIKANAEIVFYDQLSGEFTPADSLAEEVQVPNFYNFAFTNNSVGDLGEFNILNFNYSLNNEIIPVEHAGSTLPDSLLVSKRSSSLSAEIDTISGNLPATGISVDLDLDLKDFGGTSILALPIKGVLTSKSISTSIDNIVRSNINIVSAEVSGPPTIASISSAGSDENKLHEILGTNLGSSQVIILRNTSLSRVQDDLSSDQLKSIRDDVFSKDLSRSVFSFINAGAGKLRFYAPKGATTSKPEIITSVGKVVSAINVNIDDGGILVTGVVDSPTGIGSTIELSGSGFFNVSDVFFGGSVAADTFSYGDEQGFKLDVIVPDLVETGFITVLSYERNVSGSSSVNFVPVPQINDVNLQTGTTGTLVTVSGFGLNHATGALVGGNSCLATSSATATTVNITVPEDSVFGPITISGISGTTASSDFNFNVIPLLTGVVESSVDPGNPVGLSGIGLTSELLFSPDSNDRFLVTFNGQDATGLFKRTSDQGLTGLVPATALSGIVSPNRTSTILYYSEAAFNIATQAPTITGISLKSGVDQAVALFGSNLSNATGMSFVSNRTNNRVEITGDFFKPTDQGSSFSGVSFFSLDEGLQDIILKYNDPVEETTGVGVGTGFYFKTAPTITNSTPTSGILGDQVTLSGTGFYPSSTKLYFKNSINSNLLNFNSKYTFLADNNSGVQVDLSPNLSNLFASNEDNLITGSLVVQNELDVFTGLSFSIIPAPFISGFGPKQAEVGDTISVTGRSFINFADNGVFIRGSSDTSGEAAVVNDNKFTFEVPANSTSGPIEIFTTGGSFNTNQKTPAEILAIKQGSITISGFSPQPAFSETETVTITGLNFGTANELILSGFAGSTVNLTKGAVVSTTGFATGINSTSGTHIQFIVSSAVSGSHPLQLKNNGGVFSSSQNFNVARTEDFLIGYGFSGFGAGSGEATGFQGKEMVVTGSGFNGVSAVVQFVSGNQNVVDDNVYLTVGGQQRLSDSQIKFTVPTGINDSFVGRVRGQSDSRTLVESLPDITILPTISGLGGASYAYSQGNSVAISGLNNSNFPFHISGDQTPTLSPAFTLKDPNDTDISLGQNPTDFKIGITGISYDGQKTVEYIADEIYIDDGGAGSYTANQNFINYNRGNLSFEFSVSDRFFGTGRLFLVHPDDEFAIFSGDAIGVNRSTEFFANATGFSLSATAQNFDNLLFSANVAINELEPTITSFSPVIGGAGTSVTLDGTNLRGVTGLSIFSGSTESSPVANTSFTTQNSTQLAFPAPSFSELSGKVKLRTKNFAVDSTDFFKYAQSAGGGSLSPAFGQAGDTITLNASAGLDDAQEIRLVTIDNLTVTGSFTKVSDVQLTFVIPSEGRLPAPQDVDVQTYNGVSSTSNGTLTVRENTKDIFGDLDVSGDLSVSGFITGHGISGTSITATTGTFTQRPSVNGTGVLLVGEASSSTVAGSDNQVQFNNGGSFGASANLTWDDNGLYSNGYISGEAISGTSFHGGSISGEAISGTSFHGDHFVSDPYDIGNTSGTVTIDFDNGSTQLATLNGNVTAFAASNPAAGESVTVQFKTAAARTISPGTTLSYIGSHPTGLSANMTGVLSLMSFDGTTVAAEFVAQTGILETPAAPETGIRESGLLWFDPTDSSQRSGNYVLDKAVTVADTAGVRINDYVLLNGASFATVGGVTAVTTDGTNDNVGIDSTAVGLVQDLGGAFTWAIWVYPTSRSTYQDLLVQGNGGTSGGNNGHYLSILVTSGKVQIVGPAGVYNLSVSAVPLNEWSLIVYSKTSNASLTRDELLYINNSAVTIGSGAGDPDNPTNNSSKTLIGAITYNSSYYRGTKSIAEVFIYKTVLSTSQATSLWNATRAKYGK